MKLHYKISIVLFLAFTCFSLQAKSVVFEKEGSVLPLPTATIAGTTTVCQNATSPVITFTGSGGTAPYTFTYTINGGANQTISTTSGNTITLPVSTATAGIYKYDLVSVKDSTNAIQNQTGNQIVTVNPLPIADFTFTNNQCSGSPIQFNSTVSGVSPFTYLWDFGD